MTSETSEIARAHLEEMLKHAEQIEANKTTPRTVCSAGPISEALTLDQYQRFALGTAKFANQDVGIVSCLLGLSGEAGEVCEKAKKHIRRMEQVSFSDSDADALATHLKKELGDVLWYIATLSYYLGLQLSDIAAGNIEKLASRNERGLIFGQGDER